MLFNSIQFLFFFAVVTSVYFAVPHRVRWLLLLCASYLFYMWWNPLYALLILASTVVDYMAGRAMFKSSDDRRRRWLLLCSLGTNLGLLFTFKYWNFAAANIAALCHWLDIPWHGGSLDVLLPVGISFYTFQTLSYTIDIYRRRMEPEYHFGRFALYVAFFPQLVAGPIERAMNLIPQLSREQRFDWDRVASGLQLALWGMFKKVVIADQLAIYVDAVYNNTPAHNGISFILATYAFAFQIYCDFSGYSDIAIGTAKVLGFDLMKNFERPYFSKTIVEFWRRWHISLSTWLRDYLYIPLGGNRHGILRLYRNLMITMILGGLWHGASWNFVIWGTLQGVMLCLSRATLPARDRWNERLGVPIWVRDGIRMVITFHLVCLSWVFFRAATIDDSLLILTRVGTDLLTLPMPLIDGSVMLHAFAGLLVLLGVQLWQSLRGSVRDWVRYLPLGIRWAGWYTLIFAIVLFGVERATQFIYFQF